MQRARIDHAELTDEQKQLILRENAVALLDLPQPPAADQPGDQDS
jgi:predicted TIM-barrel fold metal-dependent hydrolase